MCGYLTHWLSSCTLLYTLSLVFGTLTSSLQEIPLLIHHPPMEDGSHFFAVQVSGSTLVDHLERMHTVGDLTMQPHINGQSSQQDALSPSPPLNPFPDSTHVHDIIRAVCRELDLTLEGQINGLHGHYLVKSSAQHATASEILSKLQRHKQIRQSHHQVLHLRHKKHQPPLISPLLHSRVTKRDSNPQPNDIFRSLSIYDPMAVKEWHLVFIFVVFIRNPVEWTGSKCGH